MVFYSLPPRCGILLSLLTANHHLALPRHLSCLGRCLSVSLSTVSKGRLFQICTFGNDSSRSVIPVIAASTTGGYSIPRFPPNTCLASDHNVTFYGFVLLIIILLGAGICLIIFVFWRLTFLLRGRKMQRRRTRKEMRVSNNIILTIAHCIVSFKSLIVSHYRPKVTNA